MEAVEMKIEDIEKHGVFAISLVENPAIEEDFIYLSECELKFKEIEQGLVVGLALIPEKRILRLNKQGEKYEIYFSAETIKDTAHLFLTRNQHHNATLDHKHKTSQVEFVESWIIEDENNDKINALGLQAVKGAWAVVAKVNDNKVKQDIKDGKYKGFSIEGVYEPKLSIEEKLMQLLEKYEKENC